jgi:hypothetical protein
MDYECDFQHWQWEVPDDVLRKYGSPHFSRPDAGKALAALVLHPSKGAKCIFSDHHKIPLIGILAGNEAYPETAISNPISDIFVWYDWKSGRRKFPYPGAYAPLDLRKQDPKTVSKSVVGVFGEIISGIYAQQGISVSPLSRVILRWPDFIYIQQADSHFVEAKATIDENIPGSPLTAIGKHGQNLSEVLIEAIQQFGADPWVTVWGGFVGIHIDELLELRFTMTFLELKAPQSRKLVSTRSIPPLVAHELAKRAVARALVASEEYDAVWEIGRKKQGRKKGESFIHGNVAEGAHMELGKLLTLEAPDMMQYRSTIEEELDDTISRIEPVRGQRAGRLDRLKVSRIQEPIQVRELGVSALVMDPLSDEDHSEFRKGWIQDWKRVEETVNRHGHPFYRAGGALFGLMPPEKASQFRRQVDRTKP